jgi:hypothetical protein
MRHRLVLAVILALVLVPSATGGPLATAALASVPLQTHC